MICWVLAMEMLQGVWKQHLRPRAVVGYGVKIFLPSPPHYVTRSPGQNKRVAVARMAFRARKVFETFEKRALGLNGPTFTDQAAWKSLSWFTKVLILTSMLGFWKINDISKICAYYECLRTSIRTIHLQLFLSAALHVKFMSKAIFPAEESVRNIWPMRATRVTLGH